MSTTTNDIERARLVEIAQGIGHQVQLAEMAWRDALGHAIRAGELLIEAKGLVKHGQWAEWLERHFPASERTAQNYMRLARNSAAVADLPTVREAVAALAQPKPAPVDGPQPEAKAEPVGSEPEPVTPEELMLLQTKATFLLLRDLRESVFCDDPLGEPITRPLTADEERLFARLEAKANWWRKACAEESRTWREAQESA
jgi:hypothetical protein